MGILNYIYNRYYNSREAFLTSRILIKELLLFTLSNYNLAYIILDSLDEYYSRDKRKTIIEFFRNLIENLNSNPNWLYYLFVSYKDSTRKDFNSLANITMSLENKENNTKAFSHA
jgi:archaellum biogenesis ATPase FlaH